jgi:peptidyl-dipeptidase A
MHATRTRRRGALAGLVLAALAGCAGSGTRKVEGDLKAFIEQHEATLRPLSKEAALAAWTASITGDSLDYEKSKQAQLALEKLYTSRDDFEKIRAWRDGGQVKDAQLARQLELLYLAYLDNQIPESLLQQMVEVQNQVDQIFSTFRGRIGDRSYTDNDLRDILRTSNDSHELQAAWEAGKQVGAAVQPKLLEVVRLRNEAARQLGFADYFGLQLVQQEFDETEFLRLFDELDALTRDAFAAMKAEVDQRLAARYGIAAADLRPWHYHNPFFQEAPAVFDVDLDAVYAGTDVLDVVRRYYQSVGFDISGILARSDLYEKPGKNPHAYCTDIDREGDVRVFANVRPNEYWMGTMLHEMGHAVYDEHIDRQLPWLLRSASHTLTTEAMAMLFGRMSKNAAWMQQMAGLPTTERAALQDEVRRMLTFEQLTFSRWVQVMMRFERALYADPEQDLNGLWWDLVERYQLLHRPEGRDAPDYASKYHVAMAPVYYHNYLLGELMASQVHQHIATQVLQAPDLWSVTYAGQPQVGAYLEEKVFGPGSLHAWNDLVKHATGSPLTPRAYAAQFVGAGPSS